jgi:hypothetical protein
MVLNKFVVVYYLFLFISLAVGALAAAAGLWVFLHAGRTATHEAARRLERYLYLSISAMMVGAVVRLVMVPLWFFTLQSLVAVIPGAMCLAGVHNNVPVYSWLASGMKLVLPGLYLAWLFVIAADRQVAEQPFFRTRQLLLIPLIVLLLGETLLDVRFLTALKPTPVSCCTAIFDLNTRNVPPVLTQSHWYFAALFPLALGAQTRLLLKPQHRAKQSLSRVHLGIITLAVVAFIALVLAMHTKLSPLILETPFHHCVFCLLQTNTLVLTGFVLLMVGIYLSVACGIIGHAQSRGRTRVADRLLRKTRTFILILYAIGGGCIGAPTIWFVLKA